MIVAPDPRWPQWFQEESSLVRAAFGNRLLGLEHVGSTSVPGLGAKPTVDMMAGVAGKTVADAALPALAQIGYTDVLPIPEGTDWYYCLGKGSGTDRHFHLHLARHENGFWRRHIVFRDFLRAHPGAAREYFELKRSLAMRYRDERMKYSVAKTGFVSWVEVQAAGVTIAEMVERDVTAIVLTFDRWHKTTKQYEDYYAQQQQGERTVLVARLAGEVVGYVTLLAVSRYTPLREQGIPEIADLNVINEHQGKGIGSALVYAAERLARQRGYAAVGIDVEQSPAYEAANRLYPHLGFEPDGRGITVGDDGLHYLHLLKPLC